ncbi:hypothetical protein X798_00923, partial [Onchocerca flexuosa]
MDQSNEEHTTAEVRRFASLLHGLNAIDDCRRKTGRKFIQIQNLGKEDVREYLRKVDDKLQRFKKAKV